MSARSRAAIAVALLVATTAVARADNFTWSGNSSGNVSDSTNWLGNAAPASLSTDQLLFSAAADYSVNFDNARDPWTLNSITFAGSSNASLTSSNTQGIQFTGANASLIQNSNGTTTISAPITLASDTTFSGLYYVDSNSGFVVFGFPPPATNALTITSSLSGPGALIKAPDSPTLIYQSNVIPTFTGGTTVGGAAAYNVPQPLIWNYTANASTPSNLSFGSGSITLNDGAFLLNISGSPAAPISFSNNITVNGDGRLNTSNATVTGNVFLSGSLITGGSNYSGTITIDQSRSVAFFNGFNYPVSAIVTDNISQGPVTISGNIVDGPSSSNQGNIWNPNANQVPLTLIANADAIYIAGANNTYSHGTVIGQSFGMLTGLLNIPSYPSTNAPVIVAANSSLGTGTVTINDSGILQLASLSSVAPGSVQGDGTLSVTLDADPTPVLSPCFDGGISIDAPSFTTPLNMALFGTALTAPNFSPPTVRLGSLSNATYAAPTLAPAVDHVYRLGISGGNLNVPKTILVDSGATPNSADLEGVTISAPQTYSGGTTVEPSTAPTIVAPGGTLGTGNINVNYNATLMLLTPAAYAANATVTVAGTLVLDAAGAIPAGNEPVLLPSSTLTLGDSNAIGPQNYYPTSMPIHLSASTLTIAGPFSERLSTLSFEGMSTVFFSPAAAQAANISVDSLDRSPGALLSIDDGYQAWPSGPHLNLSPSLLSNGMLPAYITYHESNFATIAPDGAIVPVSLVAMPTDGGRGNEIAGTIGSDVTLSSNTSIYALELLDNNILATSSNINLSVLSGGVNVSGSNVTIAPNLDFGTAEGIIRLVFMDSFTAPGAITARNGLTIAALFPETSDATLSNSNNSISGPINIYFSTVEMGSLGNSTDASPINIHDGALSITGSIQTSRPVVFTNNPQERGWAPNTELSVNPGVSFTTSGSVSAEGNLIINGNVTVLNSVTVSVALLYGAPSTTVGSYLSVNGTLSAGSIVADTLTLGDSSVVKLLGPTASEISFLGAAYNSTPGTLDIGNSSVVYKPSLTGGTTNLGYWKNLVLSGPSGGITSSAVNANPAQLGIAVVLNGNLTHPFTTFHGVPVDANSILITTALLGDTNLDGTVDLTDLATVYQNFLISNGLNNTGNNGIIIAHLGPYEWSDGNFDCASTIDLTDLQDVLHPFGYFPTTQSQALADAQSLLSSAPEPASLTLLALGVSLLTCRRRSPRHLLQVPGSDVIPARFFV